MLLIGPRKCPAPAKDGCFVLLNILMRPLSPQNTVFGGKSKMAERTDFEVFEAEKCDFEIDLVQF